MSAETFIAVVVAVLVTSISVRMCSVSEMKDARRTDRLLSENENCSRSGGRLVRGQADEFVCIEPKGVKWERKP